MDRIKRLAGELPEDLDAAFINSAVNRRYYTGFPSSAGVLLVTRDDATIFLDSRYVEAGARTITDARVVLTGDLTEQLNDYFEEHHIKTVEIGRAHV